MQPVINYVVRGEAVNEIVRIDWQKLVVIGILDTISKDPSCASHCCKDDWK